MTTPRLPQEAPKGPYRSACCGCCHVPDHGPCPKFEEGGAPDRCCYCDHAKKCHNKAVKGRHYNLPLDVGERKEQDS